MRKIEGTLIFRDCQPGMKSPATVNSTGCTPTVLRCAAETTIPSDEAGPVKNEEPYSESPV